MNSPEPGPHPLRVVTDVMSEGLHGQEAGDLAADSALQFPTAVQEDVEVRLDRPEAFALIPFLNPGVIPGPGLQPRDALSRGSPGRLGQQRAADAAPPVVRMDRQVPDHGPQAGAGGTDRPRRGLALQVDEPHDRAFAFGDELDGGVPVALLLPEHVVVVGGVQEGQDAAPQPLPLIVRPVFADQHRFHPAILCHPALRSHPTPPPTRPRSRRRRPRVGHRSAFP